MNSSAISISKNIIVINIVYIFIYILNQIVNSNIRNCNYFFIKDYTTHYSSMKSINYVYVAVL